MIIGGLAAASGAWEGMKLVRSGFQKLFGTKPDVEATAIQNIQINIAINGGLVSEDMADHVGEVISDTAPITLSEAAIESSKKALRASAQRAASEKSMLCIANDNDNLLRPGSAAKSENWKASDPFDQALARRANIGPASDRRETPLAELRRTLEGFDGGAIHPKDLASISGRLRWLVEHELGPRQDAPVSDSQKIDGGLVLRVIPKGGGPIRNRMEIDAEVRREADDSSAPPFC
jgi:hypothetical protein